MFVSPRMSHYACSLCRYQLHFLANRNAGLAIPPLFWPVNWIEIERHVALLSGPTFHSLYCDNSTTFVFSLNEISQIFGQDGDRKNVSNVLVLFSDGQSHDQSAAESVARKMKAKDVAIFCVAIDKGKTVDQLVGKLQQISSKKEYTFKSHVDALKTIEDSLVQDMCDAISEYT